MFLNYILPLIVSFIFVFLFVFFCTKIYKNQPDEKKLKPIKIIFYSLVILEIWKIFYLITQNGQFEPSRYPLVFCSLVMYAYPLFCFKKNKFSNVAMAFCVLPSFIVFLMFVAVQWQYEMSIIQAHSYYYHAAMMAVSIYLMTSKLYVFKIKDFYSVFLCLFGYVVFAVGLSLFIGGDISIFGPNKSFIKFFYDKVGYAIGNLILIIVIFLFCFGIYGIIELCSKKKEKYKDCANLKEKTNDWCS